MQVYHCIIIAAHVLDINVLLLWCNGNVVLVAAMTTDLFSYLVMLNCWVLHNKIVLELCLLSWYFS